MSFSVIVPFYNEEKNIKKLVDEIIHSIKDFKIFEIILINDASFDNTLKIIKLLEQKYPNFIRIINNSINIGQSFSLIKAIKSSKFDTIITLDGDGQNNPSDIPKLLKEFEKDNIFLVGGLRIKRKDNYIKKFSSKIANNIRSFILNDDCKDTGCSLKVFSKKIFLNFPEFKGVHRFLPALYKGYGYQTFFVEVDHRYRVFGKSKYGTLGRMIMGIIDLIRVYLIIKKIKYK